MAGVREIAGGGHGGANGKGQPMAKEKKWSFHVCTNASPLRLGQNINSPGGGGRVKVRRRNGRTKEGKSATNMWDMWKGEDDRNR